jgi:hypothetical protein
MQRVLSALVFCVALLLTAGTAWAQSTSIQRSCGGAAFYDASTSGATQIVPAPAGNQTRAGNTIFICGFTIGASAAVNVGLVYGTGTNCGTGTTKITPAFQFIAAGFLVDDPGNFNGLSVPAGNNLCINASGAVAVQAIIYYDNNPL